jgi:capsule polysaccharide export protein KpsE/RkpR
MALMDLLDVKAPTPALRLERTVRALANKVVSASEDRRLGAVRLTTTTRWPSVSLTVAQQLVKGVNQFNVVTRKSQASAERQFAEVQEGEAERALRDAEDRLQEFLQGNRTIVTPELGFQRERLQRNVTLRQQVYTSLVQSREEARIREVRDTPVITVIEEPRLPVLPEGRGVALKTILGALLGAIIGVVIAFVAHALNVARRVSSTEAQEFFDLVGQATPRFLRMRRKNVVAS